jgi:hypothetical protein
MEDAKLAIQHSARRVFISNGSIEFLNETIVVGKGIDRICHIQHIGTIKTLQYTMLNARDYSKVFQFCSTEYDVEKSWLLGATPIITEELAQSIWQSTINTLTPTVIIQDVGGTIKNVIKDCNLRDIDPECYEEVSINHDTFDSIVLTVDDPGQSTAFSFQTTVKSNIVELQRNVGTDKMACTKIVQEMAKMDDDPVNVFYLYLQYLNNKGMNITKVLDSANARSWDYLGTVPAVERQRKVVAITSSKYLTKTVNFLTEKVGITILEKESRQLSVPFSINNSSLVKSAFGTCDIVLLSNNIVDYAVTYNTVMSNHKFGNPMLSMTDSGVKLCLIKKKGAIVPPHPRIAAEHYSMVTESSESYIVNLDGYDLCDAVVETGSTLMANDLEIHQVLYDGLEIGLYSN